MNSSNNRIQPPTEILFDRLSEALNNYSARTPLANGASTVTRLVGLIHSRRVLFLRNESHFRSLWEEDIALDPTLVDFFLTVASDLKFVLDLNGLADGWDMDQVIAILAKSLIALGKDNQVVNQDIKERLADDLTAMTSILKNNAWAVVYILLQKMPLTRLTGALEPWRALSNNQPASDK